MTFVCSSIAFNVSEVLAFRDGEQEKNKRSVKMRVIDFILVIMIVQNGFKILIEFLHIGVSRPADVIRGRRPFDFA
jgi:hypothetical protein